MKERKYMVHATLPTLQNAKLLFAGVDIYYMKMVYRTLIQRKMASTAAEESAPLKASTDSDSGFFSLANGGGGVPGEKGAAPAVAGAKVVAGGEGEVRHNNAYNDIGLVVTRTKELEKILKDMFGASGEFCHSVYKPGF